jgi:hypothetical protein
MTGSAQRPEKPESRDGCVSRMLSLQLQKSPTPDFEEKCGNSPDISKGLGRQLPKVSSHDREYSRFAETAGGDLVRSRLPPEAAVILQAET